MYEKIKQIIFSIIPKTIIIKYEVFLRNGLYYIFYNGNNYECNICNKRLSKFIVLKNKTLMCPVCGSTQRNRGLWSILKPELIDNRAVLHFSPSRSLFRKLKSIDSIQYTSTDYEDEFLADERFDITNIKQADESYDIIICYHVLEHIEEDGKAMDELYRVLKKGGKCYIQTPFKDGDIYENENIKSEKDRLIHFGQSDHVRVYAVKGLEERLLKAGFRTSIVSKQADGGNYYGLKEEELLITAFKL